MADLKWRPQALKDLDAIEEYYEEVAPDYAALFVASVFETTRRLEELPRMGRIVPEIGDPAIRELIHRGYRIMYVVDGDDETVEVLTVLHSSRQFGD
ncbi:MAG: type II toxin-antitoxin system RelE/ParE family toxin, partial [Bacteroidetes bacterium]|nr:type II toxin-antitoxin system RelE/ParE family toxin [Bacteroidota bacterium]